MPEFLDQIYRIPIRSENSPICPIQLIRNRHPDFRQLFENAKENAPCIIFLDELDAICSSRDENTKEMSNRIIAQILTCMDDVDSAEILVLGATSKVENIDSSLRRAGRFDQEITIGIPSEKERLAVMQVVCKDLKLAGM